MSFEGISGWLSNRRRLQRLRTESQNWPQVLAGVSDWTKVNAEGRDPDKNIYQVRGTLAFTVNDNRYYGLVFSQPMGESYVDEFLRDPDKPAQLLVRYDPADPDEMFATPSPDQLPFKVWLEWEK